MVDVPLDKVNPLPRKLLDYDLKKIKSFKEIRKNYKANYQKNVFFNDMSIVLDQY